RFRAASDRLDFRHAPPKDTDKYNKRAGQADPPRILINITNGPAKPTRLQGGTMKVRSQTGLAAWSKKGLKKAI
ncbi:MAG: hypothetical protein VW870_06915, partial [Rhodobiaceae bacterium]